MQHSPAPGLWTSGDTGPAFLGTCGPQGRPQGHRPRSLEGPGRLCPGAGQIWVCSGFPRPALGVRGSAWGCWSRRAPTGQAEGGKRDNPTDMGGNRGWEIPGPPGRAPGVEAPSKGGAILNWNQPFSPGCDGIDALLKPPAFFPQVATARARKPARRSRARASRRAAGPAAPTAPRTPCGNRAAAAGWGAGRAGPRLWAGPDAPLASRGHRPAPPPAAGLTSGGTCAHCPRRRAAAVNAEGPASGVLGLRSEVRPSFHPNAPSGRRR